MQLTRIRYIKGDILAYSSIALIYFAALASLYSETTNKIGLYVAMPLAFAFTTLLNRGLRLNLYEKILYSLYIWDCIAYLWAADKEMAGMEIHMLLGAFLLSYVLSILGRHAKLMPYLYFIYILLYLSAWNYAVHHILVFMASDTDRLNDENLNANTLAYYTFYVSFLSYILGEITKRKIVRNIWKGVFWFMLPASFGIALLTASRQVLIVQLPLYAMLIYIHYIKGVSLKRKLIFLFVILIGFILSFGRLQESYNNSFLKQRSEKNIADDGRYALAKNAIQVGIENFPFGLGTNNFRSVSITRQISHNSYLEAFVNLGLIGLVLYCALLFIFTYRQWQRYRLYKDKTYFAFFTFGCIYILDGLFFVYYNALWLISFFMLVAAHSETYYKDHMTEAEPAPLKLTNLQT